MRVTCVWLCALLAAGLGDELKLVQILFRHGDRAPTLKVPGWANIEKDSDWPNGLGQLTDRGMQMHYNVGRYMRRRYIETLNFVKPKFDFKEFYVRSTDVDRTLMSANSQLASWFTPETSPFNNTALLWRPVPVHTTPVVNDVLMRNFDAQGGSCPRYGQLSAGWDGTPNYVAKNKEMVNDTACQVVGAPSPCTVAQFLLAVGRLSKMNTDLLLSQAWMISDALLCRREHGLALPEWATAKGGVVYDVMRELEDWGMYEMFDGPERRKLTGGIFIKQLLYNIAQALGQSPNPYQDSSLLIKPDKQDTIKTFLFSGHDTNVASVLEALETDHFKARAPPYASALLFELYQRQDKSTYIQLRYKNESALDNWQHDGTLLTIKGCGSSNCSVEDFKAATQAVIPDDIANACKSASPSTTSTTHPPDTPSTSESQEKEFASVIVGVAIAVVGVILVTVFVLRKRRSRHIKYQSDQLHSRLGALEDYDDDDDVDVFTANIPNAPLYRSGRNSALA
eukprot:TRINITY_DN8047_c0_g1_i1.p1 TRINITY_DN8047_c0_g1~~TRINITY_DN8047_c0_g1_i1.p1  ORF type:complete len:510 (+),score=126.70 TRINITY_DN8047_c0_g1_i1:136-1665(+)